MDEESHKRNTDCVYFLASPLTCKKGIECEYRHSDIARLNPRDCWYWLARNCLNPTCAFRHPPLEGYAKGLSESDASHSQSALPVKKKNVPCYFFFNGICNKGDRCYFMHKPDDSAPALKSTKTAVSSDAQFSEKKESLGSDTGSAPSKRKTNLSQTAAKGGVGALQSKSAQDLLKLDVNNAVEQYASPHISASDCKGVAAHSSASLPPGEGFVQHWSPACADQSSDEQVDGYIEREERLESSPGFDVLVDGSSENMGYEGEQEYLLNPDGDQGELNTSFLGYDYEDHVEYDPAYSDAGNLYDQEILDSYEHLDSERSCDYVRKVPGCRERILDRIFSRKRKLLPINFVSDNRCGMDLRDHLRKRRVPDGHSSNNSSRRHGSSRVIGRSRGRPHHNGTRRLRGRLTTEVENNFGKLHSENGTLLNDIYRDGRLEHHDINTSRLHFREKKQGKHWSHSSDIAMHSAPKKRRVTEEISVFSGPKTLAQIREEMRNARENGDSVEKIGLHSRYQTEDFQGPKSLSDILKDKKRLGSLVERNNASC